MEKNTKNRPLVWCTRGRFLYLFEISKSFSVRRGG